MDTDKFFKITEPTCISFSGGRTSAYMLWRILQAHQMSLPSDAIVCFANTGKEDEETLKFVRDCEKNWNVPIVWLEYKKDEPRYKKVTFETASRNGKPFEELIEKRMMLPNPVSRFCTVELKVRTIHRYLKDNGWTEWTSMLGIRADEQRRLAKLKNQDYGKHEEKYSPLGMAGITAKDVGDFWKSNDFDLNLPNFNGITYHGNCDLCYLKGANQIYSLVSEKPERAIWWADMEHKVSKFIEKKGTGDRFRMDRPGYIKIYDYALQQKDMFSDDEETIACFCGD